jgi:6-phosphogluconolactonase
MADTNRNIIIAKDSGRLARKGAQIFYRTAKASVARQGRFAVAVSGGSTPRDMHRCLAREPYFSALPWHSTHMFWVDERLVPYDHPASNFGAAKVDFLDNVPLPIDQIHPIPVDVNPVDAVDLYLSELQTFFRQFGSDNPVFDLIVLGIGNDGHTASLFPGQTFPKRSAKWVLDVKGGNPNVCRITLNYPVLNRARNVFFLVSGSQKARMIKTLLEDQSDQLPAAKIRPLNGKLTWLLDRNAASLLSSYRIDMGP